MHDPIEELELLAYIDGEVAPDRAYEIARAVASSEPLARRVHELRSLRAGTKRVLGGEIDAVPSSVRRRVCEMPLEGSESAAAGVTAPAPPRGRRRRRVVILKLVLAVLVVTLVGVVLVWWAQAPARVGRGSAVISAADAGRIVLTHVKCSQVSDHFLAAGFPKVVGEASNAAAAYFGVKAVVPDLGRMGYVFAGAGPCSIPGGKTLHVLYRSVPPARRALSVFLQADAGQLRTPEGRAVVVEGTDPAHPMVAWRGNGMVFYLVADSFDDVRRASDELGWEL